MANGQTFTLNIKALFDAGDIRTKINSLQGAFKNLKLTDNLKNNLQSSFTNVEKALTDFESRVTKGVKTKSDASGLTRSMDKVISEFTKLNSIVDKVKGEIANAGNLSDIIQLDDTTIKKVGELKKEISDLQSQISKINTSKLDTLEEKLKSITGKKASEYGRQALDLFKQGDIQGALNLLDQVIERYDKLQGGGGEQGTRFGGIIKGFNELRTAMSAAQGDVAPLLDQVNEKSQQMANEVSNAFNGVVSNVNDAGIAMGNYVSQASNASGAVGNLVSNQVRLNTELEQVKSRIQYFLGLSNAINLFRRAVHGAFETVKELDAAMTETAVVTDYTVKDMWDQLPEYTKRANELGVMTKDAYESATLYFQQGLNADQAAALSAETLKMARIAGLDAAEATDRMTNALRGFNMELNTASAQRVDDVYSELAAISASDVDEISTAMTKVASLAHSANMEFETTAAFLAQIIETTRESAETAGTALKTVVARFSEVKKLVNEDQLKGTDEEGQVIDVNKVSQALRTAGIDLNKYFIGEVGLDDIFMELASKWDSLTSVQQRYIATQAAGSRQQSRFIALMQDYARTQELVGAAYDAQGASARQFEKTQDSLQSKLARLKNAWNEFLMGITNSSVIKGVVDRLTDLLNLVNKLSNAFGEGASGVIKFGMAAGGLIGLRKAFKGGGAVEKILGSIGNTLPGQWLGLGGNTGGQITSAGATFHGEVVSAGAEFAAAVRGAAASEAISENSNSALTLTPWQSLQQFKSQSLDPRYLQARENYYNSPSLENLRSLGQARQRYGKNPPKTLFGALGNKFVGTSIGGKLSAGFGAALGKIGIGSGAALGGAATLATTLGIVTVAATAAAASIKAMYDASPTGQLKNAKKVADSMKKVSEATQETADNFRKVKKELKNYDDAVDSSDTISSRKQAISNRNDYIKSLIDSDPKYSKYFSSRFENGQIVLTIDEESFNRDAEKAEESARFASIGQAFAQASVAGREANLIRSQIAAAGVNLQDQTIRYERKSDTEEWVTGYRKMTSAELARYSGMESQAQAFDNTMQEYAKSAFSRFIDSDELGDELSNQLASAMATGFNESDLDTANWSFLRSRGHWANEYLKLYGVEADVNMQTADIARAVKQGNQTQEQRELVKNAESLLTGADKDFYKKLLNAYLGTGEAAEVDLSDLGENATEEEVFKKLGINESDIMGLVKLASALGVETKELREQIVENAKQNQKLQQQRKTNIYDTALSNGVDITTDFQNRVSKLSPKMTEMISGIMDSASKVLSQEGMQELIPSLFDLDESQLTQFQDFFSSFNLDDPISAFNALNNAKEKALAGTPFASMLDSIAETNKELFTTGSLVQTFVASEGYISLTDSLEGFIKENGQISSKNIKELAENCNQLQILLDQTTVSAQGLAEAFTLYENGTIAIDAMTSSLLAAFSAGESFNTLMSNVSEWIEGFSEGPDMAQGTEHIIDVLSKAEEYVSDFQFGNKPLANIYDHIFDENAYKDYMDANYGEESFNEIQKYLQGQVDKIKGWAEDEGKGALDYLAESGLSGITQIGKNAYEWDLSGYNTANKAISDIAANLGVTDEVARAFIESWGSHMYDLGQAWDELNFKDSITAFNEALGNSAVITESELAGLSASTGKTRDEILSAIEAIRGEGNVPIVVSWQDENGAPLTGQSLIDEFNKNIPSTFETEGRVTTEKFDYSEILEGLQDDANNIDLDGLKERLTEAFKLTPGQASEVANNIAESVDGKFTKEIKIPVVTTSKKDGEDVIEVGVKPVMVTGETVEDVEAAVQAAMAAGEQQNIASILAGGDYSGLGDSVAEALQTAAQQGAAAIQAAVEKVSPTIRLNFVGGGTLAKFFFGSTTATGGIVNSYARGSEGFHVKPGTSLTGEEDPELVWNKNEGYAYLTGTKGPEFQNLRPGDRVFNASETKQILKNSKGNFKYPSLASGSGQWGAGDNKSNSGDGGSKDKTSKEWKNELDWLYNLMEDIAELERLQEQLSEKHERYLEDISKTGRDLYNLTNDELNNLLTQRDNYQEALTRRMQEMREQVEASEVSQYAWWNDDDNTIEIDWDAINEITDKDKYDEVTDLISKLEKIQDQMDEAEEALWDIEGQIIELKNRYLEEFIDFQKRVYDAIVDSYQKQIDALEVLNDTINDSDSQILNSLQKEIDLQRQIRDNTEAEENIRDLEARLAYLRRDTSGANDAEIRKLEKELEDARKNYTDDLIDQALDRLQESSNEAAEQRQKQIDLLTEQLDYWKEIGAFWPEVAKLIDEGINGEGSLIRGSTLEEILKQADNWKAMSEEQKQVWADDLIKEVNQAGAYLITIAEGLDNLSAGIWALIPESSIPGKHYATGGLATVTGPAWLDGTPSEPEYVLNARQTDAFLRLADVLPSIFGNNDSIVNNNNGNTYIELNMNVGEIGSDYDVDRLVDRLKDDLYNASAYRNVNAINFLR